MRRDLSIDGVVVGIIASITFSTRESRERDAREAWERTSRQCASTSNALQCARCLFAEDCRFRIGWPVKPVIERAALPGGWRQ